MNIPSNPVDKLLPSGTVNFLFTDIEGSTSLAQNYPDEMTVLLERHNAILRQAIEAHQGIVFRITGDAFASAFHTSGDAISAALEAQRRLRDEAWHPAPIKVRMGIHTGAAQAGPGSEANRSWMDSARALDFSSTALGGLVDGESNSGSARVG